MAENPTFAGDTQLNLISDEEPLVNFDVPELPESTLKPIDVSQFPQLFTSIDTSQFTPLTIEEITNQVNQALSALPPVTSFVPDIEDIYAREAAAQQQALSDLFEKQTSDLRELLAQRGLTASGLETEGLRTLGESQAQDLSQLLEEIDIRKAQAILQEQQRIAEAEDLRRNQALEAVLRQEALRQENFGNVLQAQALNLQADQLAASNMLEAQRLNLELQAQEIDRLNADFNNRLALVEAQLAERNQLTDEARFELEQIRLENETLISMAQIPGISDAQRAEILSQIKENNELLESMMTGEEGTTTTEGGSSQVTENVLGELLSGNTIPGTEQTGTAGQTLTLEVQQVFDPDGNLVTVQTVEIPPGSFTPNGGSLQREVGTDELFTGAPIVGTNNLYLDVNTNQIREGSIHGF